jgi:hypothetical protein
VTGTGAATRIGDRVRRIDAVIGPQRQLQLVAQPDVERQRRGDAKSVLHEQPQLVLVRPPIRHGVAQILSGRRVERQLGRDRREATGQQAVEKRRVREVCRRGAGKIRRGEQPGGRVGGRDAEARGWHHLQVLPPGFDARQLPAELQPMPAALPAQLVGKTPEEVGVRG